MPVGRPPASRQLPECRLEGISCRDCIQSSAAHVARLSSEMSPMAIRQIFHSIYPAKACQPMGPVFVQIVAEQAPRKAVRREAAPFRVAAAVA